MHFVSLISFYQSELGSQLIFKIVFLFPDHRHRHRQRNATIGWVTLVGNFSEEFHEFTGLDDTRLTRPTSHKPSYKFGTTPFSHTDSTISKYFKEMHSHMGQ